MNQILAALASDIAEKVIRIGHLQAENAELRHKLGEVKAAKEPEVVPDPGD